MQKLWFEKHQKFHYQLYDHEGDEIEDFEGWDLLDVPEEQDPNEMSWLFPRRGPTPLEKEKKKRKKKKNKSKSKKKSDL